MACVHRVAIGANGWVIAAMFDQLLTAFVAVAAEALHRTEAELVPVSTMRDNVVDDHGRDRFAVLQAIPTKRLFAQLMLSALAPDVELIPLTRIAMRY
jgi:hypothetical protein